MTPAELERFRQSIKARLATRRRHLIVPDPPPRYDHVFARGVAWLDGIQDQDENPPAPLESPGGEKHLVPRTSVEVVAQSVEPLRLKEREEGSRRFWGRRAGGPPPSLSLYRLDLERSRPWKIRCPLTAPDPDVLSPDLDEVPRRGVDWDLFWNGSVWRLRLHLAQERRDDRHECL